jgi:hypothetical protein
MGSQWVDGSPSWDSIGSNLVSSFMGAPQKALANTATADEIAWNRRVRGAGMKASAAFEPALPEASATPRIMNVPGPMVGDPNVPSDLVAPRANVQYIDLADLALACDSGAKPAAARPPADPPRAVGAAAQQRRARAGRQSLRSRQGYLPDYRPLSDDG